MCEHCTRRGFLETGVAVGGLMLAGADWTHAWAADSPPKPQKKPRICVLFTGPPGPEDRGWNADPRQMDVMKKRLAEAEKQLGNIELIIGSSNKVQQTAALLEKAGPAAPVLVLASRATRPSTPRAMPCGPPIARRRCRWTARAASRRPICCAGIRRWAAAVVCPRSSTALDRPLRAPS